MVLSPASLEQLFLHIFNFKFEHIHCETLVYSDLALNPKNLIDSMLYYMKYVPGISTERTVFVVTQEVLELMREKKLPPNIDIIVWSYLNIHYYADNFVLVGLDPNRIIHCRNSIEQTQNRYLIIFSIILFDKLLQNGNTQQQQQQQQLMNYVYYINEPLEFASYTKKFNAIYKVFMFGSNYLTLENSANFDKFICSELYDTCGDEFNFLYFSNSNLIENNINSNDNHLIDYIKFKIGCAEPIQLNNDLRSVSPTKKLVILCDLLSIDDGVFEIYKYMQKLFKFARRFPNEIVKIGFVLNTKYKHTLENELTKMETNHVKVMQQIKWNMQNIGYESNNGGIVDVTFPILTHKLIYELYLQRLRSDNSMNQTHFASIKKPYYETQSGTFLQIVRDK